MPALQVTEPSQSTAVNRICWAHAAGLSGRWQQGPAPVSPHHLLPFCPLLLPSCAPSWRPASQDLHRLLHHSLCGNRAGNLLLHSSASHGETFVILVGTAWGPGTFCTSQHKDHGPLAPQPWLLPASTSWVKASPPPPQRSSLGYFPPQIPQYPCATVEMSPWVSRDA